MHSLHHRDGHHGWDRARPAVSEVEPGTTLELVLADCFGGQLGAEAGPADVAAIDLDRANPLTGPIHVAGLAAGDTLAVELLDVTVGPVGWTALLPGFGLLADDFPDPHVVVSSVEAGVVAFGDIARLPASPFLGTIGLAPGADGEHSVIPPRRVGGNLDTRDVRAGTTLLLPVEVDGGLLSAGDAHATQGDGEVCGTAVEVAATATVCLEVRRGLELTAPQIELPVSVPPTAGRRRLTTGVGPDLHAAARDATRAMIDHLAGAHDLDPADAYALCSVAGHLRITEVVDAPNWVVAMDLDLDLLS